jgi:hypothetical protein
MASLALFGPAHFVSTLGGTRLNWIARNGRFLRKAEAHRFFMASALSRIPSGDDNVSQRRFHYIRRFIWQVQLPF